MTEIASFWKGSRAQERARHRKDAGGMDVTSVSLLAMMLLGAIDPALWRNMAAAPYVIGLNVGLLVFGLVRPGTRRLIVIGAGLGAGLGLVLLKTTDLGLQTGIGSLLYLAGLGIGAAVIGTERWLPSLGRIGDRSSFLGFAVRWQILVASLLGVQFLLFALGRAMVRLTDLLHAELAALLILTLLHFARIGRTVEPAPGAGRSLRTQALTLLGAGIVALQILGLDGVISESWATMISMTLSIGLLPTMIVFGVLRSAAGVAVVLAALSGAVLAGIASSRMLWPDEATNLGLLITLSTLVSLAARLGDWQSSRETASALTERFQDHCHSWMVRVDFDTQTVSLPLMETEKRRSESFAGFFHSSDPAGLLDFMSRIERRTEESGLPMQPETANLRVNIPGEATRSVTASLLSAAPGHAWVALRGHDENEDVVARLEQAETSLAMMRIREERLLSVASHEMRTPVTILSMLVEELKSGADWREVEFSFETSLARLGGILDDLRVAGAETAYVFTLNELSGQVLDVFNGAAAAQGMTIRLALSQHSDVTLRADPARIVIALSKVVHNAIVHSQGKEVVLGAMLTQEDDQTGQVSWFVADDGAGIRPELRERLFEPFMGREDAGLGTEQAVGLGLYTARKAIRLMGGDIRLERTGEGGTEFVITHPVRIVAIATEEEQEQKMTGKDTIGYPERSVLLVEDNKLVGELTANRLRRIFGTVHWAETGTDGLQMFRNAPPDMLFIDQLLPGMTGSELIEQVRLANPKVPIVGVTASTMGSECEILEAAGANIAVEKPLSYSQLQILVSDFLGQAR